MPFLALEKLINLHDGYRRRIKRDALDLLVLQEQGNVHIIQSRCPHQEHPLEQAEVLDGLLICPLHQFGFSLETGEHVGGLCAALRIWHPVFEDNSLGIVVE